MTPVMVTNCIRGDSSLDDDGSRHRTCGTRSQTTKCKQSCWLAALWRPPGGQGLVPSQKRASPPEAALCNLRNAVARAISLRRTATLVLLKSLPTESQTRPCQAGSCQLHQLSYLGLPAAWRLVLDHLSLQITFSISLCIVPKV